MVLVAGVAVAIAVIGGGGRVLRGDAVRAAGPGRPVAPEPDQRDRWPTSGVGAGGRSATDRCAAAADRSARTRAGPATATPTKGSGIDHLPPQAFGGALRERSRCSSRTGGRTSPTGRRYEIPVDPGHRARRAPSGHGQFLHRHARRRARTSACWSPGSGGAGALAVALPLTTVDSALSRPAGRCCS